MPLPELRRTMALECPKMPTSNARCVRRALPSAEHRPVNGDNMTRIGAAVVRECYGVDPKQVSDFIALRGDPTGLAASGPSKRLLC